MIPIVERERYYLERRINPELESLMKQMDTANWYIRLHQMGVMMIPALIVLNSIIARFINEFISSASAESETFIRVGTDSVTAIIILVVLSAFIRRPYDSYRMATNTATLLKEEWLDYSRRQDKYALLAGERAFTRLVAECERILEQYYYPRLAVEKNPIKTLISLPESKATLSTSQARAVVQQMQRPYSHDVFLSYSRTDRDMMQSIGDFMRESGLIVWTDESLEAGSPSWKNDIETAIENTFCVVVLLSPDAKESRWVGEELNYAETLNVPVYPVLARGNDANAVPFGFTLMQRIDLRVDFQTNINELVHLISSAQESLQYGDNAPIEQLARVELAIDSISDKEDTQSAKLENTQD